jgi:hypothetical protein
MPGRTAQHPPRALPDAQLCSGLFRSNLRDKTLAMRAFGIAAIFAIVGHYFSPTPPEHRPGLVGWLWLYLVELGAYILLYYLYYSFETCRHGTALTNLLPVWRNARPALGALGLGPL